MKISEFVVNVRIIKNYYKLEYKFKSVHGDKYDYSLVIYENSKTKIKIICKEHGIFEQTPYKHLQGRNCSECSKIEKQKKMTATADELVKKFIIKHKDTYDYSLVTRESSTVKIICKEHGIFEQNIRNHLSGRGCPSCGGSKKLEQIDVIAEFKKVHSTKYDYSLVNYKNSNDKLKIICKEHGVFEQTRTKHAAGRGCHMCGGSKKLEQIDVINRLNIVHNNKYDYSLLEYTTANDKLKIMCKEHGVFEQAFSNHIRGKGCPACSHRISSKEIELSKLYENVFVSSDRNIIKPLEIDLLSEHYKLGIEYNGMMYHSSGKSSYNMFNTCISKNYHYNKTILMEKENYQLFHIFENEFLDIAKKNIWLSLINEKLNIYNEIIDYAECIIAKISNKESNNFLNINHLLGYSNTKLNYGLFYNNIMVAIICLKVKDEKYIVTRLCNKINYNIPYYEKTLIDFIIKKYNPNELTRIENRRYNNILNTKYKLISSTEPNCFYFTHDKYNKLYKVKENKEILTYLSNNKYRIIYDSGNNIYNLLEEI